MAALYDIDSGWSKDRDFYLSQAGSKPTNILDIGCGTGLLCRAYASQGHRVTGIDPAQTMLDVGGHLPNGDRVDWVHSNAQDYRSAKRFDLIIMTGHAFQVLLTDRDVSALFEMIKTHLSPAGTAVFESRNPGFDWASVWDSQKTLDLPDGTTLLKETRHSVFKDELMTFEHVYHFPGAPLTSQSTLRFATDAKIEALLNAADLAATDKLGDWQGGPFDAARSREIIFKVSHR